MPLDESLCVQKTRNTNIATRNYVQRQRRWELSPLLMIFNESSWVGFTGGRQAACDAALGLLHLFGRDVLGLLRHVGLELRDLGAVTDGHANSNLDAGLA